MDISSRTRVTSDPNGKVMQPLPALPAFSVVSIVLGYFDYRDVVVEHLQSTSKLTRRYYQSYHKDILFEEVRPYPLKQHPHLEVEDDEKILNQLRTMGREDLVL